MCGGVDRAFKMPPPLSSRRSSRFMVLRHSSWPSISTVFPLLATVRICLILKSLMPVVWYNGIVCMISLSELVGFKKG